MRQVKPLLLGVLLPAVLVLSSCGKREDLTLAEFADRKITVGQFESSYARVEPKFLPKTGGEEGKKEFLNTMLNKEVMAYQADILGYEKDPSVIQGMETYTKLGLQAAFIQRRVAERVTVSEEEVRWHYDNTGVNLSVKEIVCDTPDEIELAHAALKDGIDFESVCRRYSKSPDAPEGGTITTITYPRFMPLLLEQAYRLGVGEYTVPTYTPAGFVILKVVQRDEPKSREPFENVRDKMEEEYRRIKEAIENNAMTEEVRDEYGVAWNWDSIRICFEALPPDRDINNAPRRDDEVYPLLYFDQGDLDKPVVTYRNKAILIKDFSDYYDRGSFYSRPRRNVRTAGIRTFLTERIMNELVMDYMEKTKIAEDPEVIRVLQSKKEELMIGRLYDEMINKQTVVTTGMVNSYYIEHEAEFQVAEKRRFGVIVTSDLETAAKAYQALQGGELFRNVVMAFSIDEETKKNLGETEALSKGEQPEIDNIGFALAEVGSFSEPFQTARGWMILRLAEKFPGKAYTLGEARDSIKRALKQLENEKKLNELLAKWKDDLNITINENNLRKARIEERSAADPPVKSPVSRKG